MINIRDLLLYLNLLLYLIQINYIYFIIVNPETHKILKKIKEKKAVRPYSVTVSSVVASSVVSTSSTTVGALMVASLQVVPSISTSSPLSSS